MQSRKENAVNTTAVEAEKIILEEVGCHGTDVYYLGKRSKGGYRWHLFDVYDPVSKTNSKYRVDDDGNMTKQ